MPKEVKTYPPIPEPELTPGPNTLALLYKALNIEIRTARLTETSRGRVLGEVEIIRPDELGEDVLHVTTGFDFHSNSYRSDLIRSMAHKDNNLDWQGIVEDICDRVIKHQRTGTPEAIIDTTKIIFHKPAYLLKPFLPLRQPAIFLGRKSHLKSTVTMLMALVLAIGWKPNPFGFILEEDGKRYKTLWCDFETDQEGFEYDLMRLKYGIGIDRDTTNEIIYLDCTGETIFNIIERIKELVIKYKIDLVVIDSIAAAVGASDLRESNTASGYNKCLRSLKTTTCSLAHPPKDQLKETSVSGAGQFEDQSRIIWEFKVEQQTNDTIAHQAIFLKKPYKTGKLSPMGLVYDITDELIIIVQENPHLSDFILKPSLPFLITEALAQSPKTHKEIQDYTGKSNNSVSVALNRLAKDGKIVKLPSLQWALKYQEAGLF